MIKPSGLISGDEVRNAIIGPQGNVVVNMPRITAIVPHAQSGVNAPSATLPHIDAFVLRINARLSFSASIYTVMRAAMRIAKLSGIQLCDRLVITANH